MSGIWITCPNCGEKRDSSNRYTSPANAEKDHREWKEQHESGLCTQPSEGEFLSHYAADVTVPQPSEPEPR